MKMFVKNIIKMASCDKKLLDTKEQPKERKLCKIKYAMMMVAVLAMVLLIIVAFGLIIKNNCTESNDIDCQNPPDVMNSTFKVSGEHALYQCVHGFYPVGETSIVCQKGNWSDIKFKCSKYCELPPVIPYSKSITSGKKSGARTSYQCLSGYVPVGHPNIFCKSNGDWSTGNITCFKDCPNPPDVLRSISWKHANKSGVYSTYQCQEGFYLVGESSIMCQDGKWSAVRFTCYKYCGSPPSIPYSTSHTSGNKSGAITTYQCVSGYLSVGHPNIVCDSNGKWSAGNLSCFKDCPNPPDVLSSTGRKHANRLGVFASYQCNNGYYLVGESSIMCQDGIWSTIRFTCYKYCGSPPVVPYSTNHVSGNKSGGITSYQCDRGYVLVGHPKIVCNSNGEWSTEHISCLKDCGPPPSKYFSDYTSTYYGSVVHYYCSSGYIGVGSPTSTCQSNGEWTWNSFYCKHPEPVRSNAVTHSSRGWTFMLILGIMVHCYL